MPLRLAALPQLVPMGARRLHAGIAAGLLSATLLAACTNDTRTGGVTQPMPSGTISLSLTPSSLTLAPGGVGGLGLSITREGSFAGAVTLAASGVPAGVNLTFGSSTVSSGSVSTSVNLTVASNAAPGTSEISIVGTGGGIMSLAAKLTLRIQQ